MDALVAARPGAVIPPAGQPQPLPSRLQQIAGSPTGRTGRIEIGGPSLRSCAPEPPGEPATTGSPAPDERLASLERELFRLRREMDRLLRLMALLEHDLAIERIVALKPGILGTLVARLKRWTSWLRA